MKTVLFVVLAGMLASCGPTGTPPAPPPPGPIPDTGISLSEGVCFGTCPDYTVTVYPNDFYRLDLRAFTRAPGTTETGVLPPGTFTAANDALRTANFNALPTDVTIGSPACGDQTVSDLPRAAIGEVTIAGARTVDYYPGCFGAPDRPALDTLLSSLRAAFGIPGLVAQP